MKRIQRKRTKGWRMPENAVYVGRPTKWGNPYQVGKMYIPEGECLINPFNPKWEMCKTIEQCLELYKQHLNRELKYKRLKLEDLKGKDLACFCSLSCKCHVDVLLEAVSSACT